MLSDNPIFENPYLNVENKIMNVLGEINESLTSKRENVDLLEIESKDDVEYQLFSSFVKEKKSLISYVNDLVNYAAQKQ